MRSLVINIARAMAPRRPELATILVDTRPTGLMFVLGLDPTNRVLRDHYDEIVREFRKPDPQSVPQQLLDRGSVQQPQRVLDAGFWKVLRQQREEPSLPDFHRRLREQLAEDLGPAYGPTPAADLSA